MEHANVLEMHLPLLVCIRLQGDGEVVEGVGSGVVWAGPYVVTNYHCVSKFVLDKTGKQVKQGCSPCLPYPAP